MIKKVIISVICISLIIGIILGGKYLYQTWKYKKIVSEIDIVEPNLTRLKDGTYKGSFDAIMVAADVSVVIEDHKIKDINLDRHYCGGPGKYAEVITDKVIAAQSLEVDTISGATNSSKVILKAIDNALMGQES